MLSTIILSQLLDLDKMLSGSTRVSVACFSFDEHASNYS